MRIRRALCGVMLAASAASFSRAQVISQFKDLPDEDLIQTAIDGTGTAVYVATTSNQLGTNAAYRAQIIRFDPLTGTGTQVTSFVEGVRTVSVTDDGQWLAFISQGNLTGANNDKSAELFVMHPDGTGLSQLTSDASFTGRGVFSAMISGSGNRVLFSADTNPLGTNPQRALKFFVVNPDGTGLVQLGEAFKNPGQVRPDPMMSISDDGEKIGFIEPLGVSSQAVTIEADGSNRQQRATASSRILVSGNGMKIVIDNTAMNWDGTGAVTLPGVGGITDDGSTVFYQGGTGVRKIGSDGAGDASVLANTATYNFSIRSVSGDGSRVATVSYPTLGVGKENLVTVNGAGGEQVNLTSLAIFGSSYQVAMLPNATRLFFGSNGNFTGANPQNAGQIFTMMANGTGLTQVTDLQTHFHSYSVSDAASLVIETPDDLLGTNPCHARTLYRINPGGTPVQLTFSCPTGFWPVDPQFRFDGQWIVYQTAEIMKIKPDATGLAQVTSEHSSIYARPKLSATAITTWIAYLSDSNDDGLNPSRHSQVVRITLDGTSRQRITNDQAYDSLSPDISGDGSKVVWESQGSPTGQNPSHVLQIFLFDTVAGTTRQLTQGSCDALDPRMSRNGAWVYYETCSGLLRVAVSGGAIERVPGFGNVLHPSLYDFDVFDFSPDTTGTKTAIAGSDILGLSSYSRSIYIVDQSAKPKLTVGKASPTLLTWDPDPQSIKYDVVRGNVAGLAFNGSTVDLGAVACLENDSGDNNTAGYEDALDPSPGQVFFYLYRGTVGDPPVTASYGLGTGNRERVAGAGGCNP